MSSPSNPNTHPADYGLKAYHSVAMRIARARAQELYQQPSLVGGARQFPLCGTTIPGKRPTKAAPVR